jgi:hypothetical protein
MPRTMIAEVAEDGRVGGARDARPIEDADLRHHAAQQGVVVEVLPNPPDVGEEPGLVRDAAAARIHQVEDRFLRAQRALLHA